MKHLKKRFLDNPPVFNPDKWKKYTEAGCYPYAINLRIHEFLLIGDFLEKRCSSNVSDKKVIKTLQKELKFLGFSTKLVEKDYIPKKKEFLIYLKREVHTGYYHFYRQDKDGTWSHKDIGYLPIQCENFYKEVYVKDEKKQGASGWMIALKKI